MKKMSNIHNLVAGVAAITMFSSPAIADGHKAPLTEFAKQTVADWVKNPEIVSAIKAQNAKNASLSETDIIALDKKWRAETKSSNKPMIDGVLANKPSKTLKGYKQAAGDLVTEIFIM